MPSSIHLLTLNDRAFVQDYLHRFPPQISEHTYTNLFVWHHFRPIWLAEVMDSLVILADGPDKNNGDKIFFGQPLGRAPLIELKDALGMEIVGSSRIVTESAIPFKKNGFHVHEDRDNADYVYLSADLARLTGRHFSKKRNHVKHCLKNYQCEYEEITPGLIPACLDMQNRWCESRQCGRDLSLCHENLAIREVFKNYEKLNLFGGAIRVNGKIQAYAIGEELNQYTAVWHFEKAFPGINGLGQLINNWFAKYALEGFKFVNREQDLGIAGLRQAKKSYCPHHMVEKFNVSFSVKDFTELKAESCP